jgi:putative salt-induced outer membrane protein YdiY
MKCAIITLLAICALSVTAVAQRPPITAPSVTNPPPKDPWAGSAAAGLTLTRGNTRTLLFSGSLEAIRKWDDAKNELDFGANGVYGENDGHTDAKSIRGSGQYNRLFTERFFGYFRVEGLYDGIAGIHYRLTLSPGAGYYFVKNTNTALRGEVGPGFVWEEDAANKTATQTNGVTHHAYYTLRFAERFDQRLSDHAKLWQTVEILPQVDKFENYILNAVLGVESSMTKTLSLQAVLADSYHSRPPAGRLKNDLKLIAGVKYTF